MFSKDACKWMYVAGMYESSAILHLRMGKILTRKEFMSHAVLVLLGVEDIAEHAIAGKRFEFPQIQAPAPQLQQRVGMLGRR